MADVQPGPQDEYERFLASPVGQARLAFARGDKLFQFSYAVARQEAVLIALSGIAAPTTSSDPR